MIYMCKLISKEFNAIHQQQILHQIKKNEQTRPLILFLHHLSITFLAEVDEPFIPVIPLIVSCCKGEDERKVGNTVNYTCMVEIVNKSDWSQCPAFRREHFSCS